MLIKLEHPDEWWRYFGEAISDLLPRNFARTLSNQQPEGMSGAANIVLDAGGQDAIVESVTRWLSAHQIEAYHGTRLDDHGRESIRRHGLIALDPTSRQRLIESVLQEHPDWPSVKGGLPNLIKEYGNGRFGGRAHQVHFAASHSYLVEECNHYLIEGSEFDSAVARHLLGNDALALLRRNRTGTIVTVHLAAATAIEAANPNGFGPDGPDLIRAICGIWALKLMRPKWNPLPWELGLVMYFRHDISPERIAAIEVISDNELLPHYVHPDPDMRLPSKNGGST